MDTEKLNRWLSLGANLGVLVGIIFLAIELQQNNELLQAQTEYNYFANSISNSSELRTSEEFGDLLAKIGTGEDLTASERIRADAFVRNMLLRWQYEFREMKKGRLDPATFTFHDWTAIFNGEGVYPAPDFAKAWPMQKRLLDHEFVEFMESQIIGNPAGEVVWTE